MMCNGLTENNYCSKKKCIIHMPVLYCKICKAKMLRSSIDPNKCKHGEYTDKKFSGCKTCGSAVKVKCKFQDYGYVNSGGCNKAKCDKFVGKAD